MKRTSKFRGEAFLLIVIILMLGVAFDYILYRHLSSKSWLLATWLGWIAIAGFAFMILREQKRHHR